MKTTVEIQDELLESAKRQARAERTTLRALIEEGLRRVLRGRRKTARFRLRDASVEGKGVQDGIREGEWETVRSLIYEGRGG